MKLYLKVYLVLLLLLTATGCNKKNPNATAMREVMFLESTDTMPVKKRTAVLDSMYRVVSRRTVNPADTLNLYKIRMIAYRHYFDGEYERHRNIMHRIYRNAVNRNDSARIAYAYYNIGACYDAENVRDSALYYRLKAGKIYEKLHDSLNMAHTIYHSANLLFYQGGYAEAETEAIKALKIYTRLNAHAEIFDSYIILGSTLNERHHYTQALKYYGLAEAKLREMERQPVSKNKQQEKDEEINKNKSFLYNDLGVLYDKQGKYAQAINFYNKTLAIKGISKIDYATNLGNRGAAKMMLGINEKDYLADINESYRILDSADAEYYLLEPKKYLAKHLLKKHDTVRAIVSFKNLYNDAREAGSVRDMLEALKLLGENDPKNGKKHLRSYFNLNDSLQRAERAIRDKFARIAFETETIEKENSNLNRQSGYAMWATIVIAIFALGIILIIRLNERNKKLIFNQKQQRINQDIYNLLLEQETETELAKKEERDRLAGSLNNEVVNHIKSLRNRLNSLPTKDIAKKQLLINELDETGEEIYRLSHDLQLFIPGNENFTKALSDLVAGQQEPDGPDFKLDIHNAAGINMLQPEVRVALFRIVQEACTNIKKHAQASKCFISINRQDGQVKMIITDNGRGFDPKRAKNGIGMKNISERATLLGGSLTVTSAEGKGTILEITI